MKFSVIIPIYNVEKYLVQCVESILCQNTTDYELILVDDGATDKCGLLCDKYAENNSMIKVVHKKNGGLSSARNAGLDLSEGEFIIFLDSDDFWDDANALKNIKTQLEESNADVLVFPAKRYYEDKKKFTHTLNTEIDRKKIIQQDTCEAIRYMIEQNVFRAAAWNKVIRKELIDTYKMQFKEGYLSEDMDWCGDLLLHSTGFDFYSKPIYVYRQQRDGSITKEKKEKLVSDKVYMCQKGLMQVKLYPDKVRSELVGSYYAYEYSVLLGVSGGIKDKKLLIQIKTLKELLSYDVCNKVRRVNKLMSFIGYDLTRKALIFFVKIKR